MTASEHDQPPSNISSPLPPGVPAPPVTARRTNKRHTALLAVAAVVALAGIGFAIYHFSYGRWHEDTDDAYVQGNIVTITPQSGGTVVDIAVEDGMRVQAGQTLVRLDRTDSDLAYEQAVANLGATVRQVRGVYRSVDASQADVDARRTAVKQAQDDVNRRRGLVASGAVSGEELAHAQAQLAAAQAALAAANEQVARNRALVDHGDLRDNPQVQAAAAAVRQAYLATQRSEVLAPVDGYVAKRSVQLGQRIAPGTPLMAIIPLDQVWVEANFKETQLGQMRLGQPVTLRSELYGDDVIFHGTLESLGMGTGSAFALLPAQNASGNWIKIVQRVPVRIAMDKAELQQHPLRLGLSMHANVDLHSAGHGLLPTAAADAKSAFSTQVYAQQLAKADTLIAQIIDRNLGVRAR